MSLWQLLGCKYIRGLEGVPFGRTVRYSITRALHTLVMVGTYFTLDYHSQDISPVHLQKWKCTSISSIYSSLALSLPFTISSWAICCQGCAQVPGISSWIAPSIFKSLVMILMWDGVLLWLYGTHHSTNNWWNRWDNMCAVTSKWYARRILHYTYL